VVGNGPNVVAAEEVRIKLSELCYKSIACDITEDKKHIDLSSEPLILVCAAGLVGGTADDVGKEVAIYRAHKATPIVVATEGDERFAAAAAVLTVPRVDPALGFVLSAMVGHLWGYEAALAIDASARPLREAREVIERAVAITADGDAVLARVRAEIPPFAERFLDTLRAHGYDGQLEASTTFRLTSILRDALSDVPARGVPARLREDRHTERPDRRPHAAPDPRDRGADATDRRDQAPGEDRHGRHQPQRRGCSRPSARAGAPRRRREP
jgi:glucosamine--fructose-6-phosphate aminotransferase (isomerizing)